MIVKGITIHNTANDLSAQEYYDLLYKKKRLNYCHYIVDELQVLSTISEEQEASHTGKGYDFGNRYTLAIEIARSMCDEELYLKAQDKAIVLIKELMKKYHLTKDDIYFHIDFNQQARCPHRILDLYKSKEEFINEFIV